MKKIITNLILICWTFSISHANEVVILNKSEAAPYSGYLFPKDKALQFKTTTLENEELKLINESYKRSLILYQEKDKQSEQQINILLKRNDQMAKDLTSARSMTNIERVAWFVGGIVVSGFAVYGATKLAK